MGDFLTSSIGAHFSISSGILGTFLRSLRTDNFQLNNLSNRLISGHSRRQKIKSNKMDVFLMIRRKKLTIFTDCKDSTTVLELKKMIQGILKISPENQQLYNKDNEIMEDDKVLQDYGLTSSVAKAQCPAPVGLALRLEPEGDFEPLEITPFSSPPDLPDVMKVAETNGQEQTA